jgi:hypothetical protein
LLGQQLSGFALVLTEDERAKAEKLGQAVILCFAAKGLADVPIQPKATDAWYDVRLLDVGVGSSNQQIRQD